MAIAGIEIGGGLSKVIGGLAWVIVVLVAVGLALVLGYFINRFMKYRQYSIVIYEVDKYHNVREKHDRGGIFVDKKTNNKLLFLKKNKLGINPDHVPYIVGPGGRKVAYFIQTGLKNFRALNLKISNPDYSYSSGEEELNWMINQYQRSKWKYSSSTLAQILPWAGLAFVGLIMLILFYYLFQKFDVISAASSSLQQAAESLRQANTGTVIN